MLLLHVARRCGALALGLWGAVALAQATLIIKVGGRDSLTAGPNECASSVQVTWETTVTSGLACQDLTLWVTTGNSCGTAPGASDLVLDPPVSSTVWISQRTGTYSIQVGDLPIFSASDAGTCPLNGVEQVHRVCGYSKYTLTDCGGTFGQPTEVKPTTPPTLTFDAKPPATPSISAVTPLDGALLVTYTAGADADTIGLDYRVQGDPDFAPGPEGPSTAGPLQLSGLQNGTTYEVRAWAKDSAGNKSGESGIQSGTPVLSYGFFKTYKDAGGAEDGGCSHAGTAAPLLLALLSLWPLARRRFGRAGKGDA